MSKMCPYCGYQMGTIRDFQEKHRRPRGKFVRKDKSGGSSFSGLLQRLALFLRDNKVPLSSKIVPVFGIIYILYPMDFFSAKTHPFIGWLDDVLVAKMTWQYIKSDLDRYRKRFR